jgi:DNA ligase-1
MNYTIINNENIRIYQFHPLQTVCKPLGNAKEGKIKLWNITVKDSGGCVLVETVYGFQNQKMTTSTTQIDKGKNIGKKNETTPFEQAIILANTKWNKKRKEGYNPSTHHWNQMKNETKEQVFLPMLANKYEEKKKFITFPCFVQPKLDGVRCIYSPSTKSLYSRTGKKWENFDHIISELDGVECILDGELYTNELTFNQLNGLAKKNVNTATSQSSNILKIKFHVFDIYLPNEPFHVRLSKLNELKSKNEWQYISIVQTEQVTTEQEILTKLDEFTSDKFEGIMIRNMNGIYKSKHRSNDLLKLKKWFDDEFEIVDFKDGVGNDKGCIIFICKTKFNKQFSVVPNETHDIRKKLFIKGKTLIGQFLNVRYQELDEYGTPRFGKGIYIRDITE